MTACAPLICTRNTEPARQLIYRRTGIFVVEDFHVLHEYFVNKIFEDWENLLTHILPILFSRMDPDRENRENVMTAIMSSPTAVIHSHYYNYIPKTITVV